MRMSSYLIDSFDKVRSDKVLDGRVCGKAVTGYALANQAGSHIQRESASPFSVECSKSVLDGYVYSSGDSCLQEEVRQ